MANKTFLFVVVTVLLVACMPADVPAGSELAQSVMTETAVATPTVPTATATPRPAATLTPMPTIPPETAVATRSPLPTPAPPDACPPNQPESAIDYSSNVEDYLGKQFAELPAGWEDWGGYVVRDNQYGQYLIRKVEREEHLLLWLEKEVCRHYYTTYSSPHLEIMDVLFLPLAEDTGNGPRLIESTCWKIADYPADSPVEEKEREVDTLLAIGYFEDYYAAPTEILFAWEINLEVGRFEELLPETVACTGLLGL